jgi:zinc protease
MPRILFILAGTFLALLGQAHAASPAPVHEYTLKNGLKIIVKEDHRAPVVVSQIWYKVGSGYEHNGITGISHVLEHMMFKGTRDHPAGEFSRIISTNGGRENAFTAQDYTAYFQQLEKSRLKISFELEADRMRHLLLPEEEFAREIKVVMEERRLRTEDDPEALTYEQFMAAAFVNSTYHHPIIGWMDDLRNLEIADLRSWYQQWYAPNNAVLVVVGDVDPAEVQRLAEKYFAPLKPSKIVPLKPQKEIIQSGERRIIVKAPAELPYIMMGFKVPSAKNADADWEPYALEVLTAILDGGDSARFARNLVRGKQIAASAGAGYDMYTRQQDQLTVYATPAQGRGIGELETALRTEIAALRETPVADDELARVKTQVVANAVYERDSVFYQAMQIGVLETVGLDWRLLDQYVDRIRAITAEQVREVARRYLLDDHLTVAVLEPLPLDQGEPSPHPHSSGPIR